MPPCQAKVVQVSLYKNGCVGLQSLGSSVVLWIHCALFTWACFLSSPWDLGTREKKHEAHAACCRVNIKLLKSIWSTASLLAQYMEMWE